MTHLNDISKVYMEKVSKPDFLDLDKDGNKKEPMKKAAKEVEAPKERLKTDRDMFSIPKGEKEAAKERLLAKARAKRAAMQKEGLDPVGQEDKDIDNDGDHDKTDKYLMKRRKAIGKAISKRNVKEGFSNWRQDLFEVMTDDEAEKPIKEKKVENKIKINPKLGEALEEIGATLIEMIEVDEFDYIVESVYDELLEEGYEEDDVEEAIEYALTEAKVTFGHDTPTKKDDVMKKAKGRLRFLGRKISGKVGSAKKAIRYASAKAQVAAYNKGREVVQTAGDKTRKARKAVADAPTQAKKGIKGAVKKVAQKVVNRMSEETCIDEMNAGPSTPIKIDPKMGVVPNQGATRVGNVRLKPGTPAGSLIKTVEEVEQVDEKMHLATADMGDVIKDFQKSDAPQFKGKSKEERRQMAIAAKLTAERGGKKLGEETEEKGEQEKRRKIMDKMKKMAQEKRRYETKKFQMQKRGELPIEAI